MSKIKSTASRVLSSGQATDEEAKSLAAYALGQTPPMKSARSLQDLERLLAKVEGVEGQKDRADDIRAEIAKLA